MELPRLILSFVLIGHLTVVSWGQFNQAKVDEIAEAVLGCRDIVGMNLAIVQDDVTVYTQGYGVSELADSGEGSDDDPKVTNQTLFGIASLSKAFAATLLGKLLDRHPTYTWDTPVRDILGDDMYFPTATMTTDTTLRDLLSHKMGLSHSNNVRFDNEIDRQELVRRIRFLEPVTPYKGSYLYNNLMYGVLSRVTEVIGQGTWEDLMEDELFKPLGMTSTSFTHVHNMEGPEVAKPYRRTDEGSWRNVSLFLHSVWGKMGGSGSVLSSARDMTNWLKFQLSQGRSSENAEVVPPEVIEATHTPENLIPDSDSVSQYIRPNAPVTYTLLEYGMGWRTGYYRGYRMVAHTGTSWGYGALLTLIPDLNIGIYTSINGYDPTYRGRRALHIYILDQLMGETPWLNTSTACTFPIPNYRRSPRYDLDLLRQNTPSQPLDHYAGTYGHFAYGNITINVDEESQRLVMTDGVIGRWILYPMADGADTFMGDGQGHTWSSKLHDVIFARHENDKFQSLTPSSFERRAPPEFVRGLKRLDAPAPPALDCLNTASASSLSISAFLCVQLMCYVLARERLTLA